MSDFTIENGILTSYTGSDHYPEIPDETVEIGEGAFKDCRDLYEVTIPAGVKRIGDSAFEWCVNLKKVTGAEGLLHIGRDVFNGTPFYKYYCENETDWKESFLILGKCLIKGRRNITAAVIPDGIRQIASDAFAGCVLLRNVEIAGSVTEIGWRAFSECTGIFDLVVPGNVRTIGWRAFKGCTRLKSITLCEGTETIEGGAFSGCRFLEHIVVPDSVVHLGSWAFFACTNLLSVKLGDEIKEIGEWTFSGCDNLSSVNIPKCCTAVGADAFFENINLTELPLPDSLRIVGKRAFAGCRYIKKMPLPAGLSRIEEEAFAGCWAIEELTVPGSLVTVPDHAFYGCDSLKRLVILSGVTSIGREAFAECAVLSEVTVPATVKQIGAGAFHGCSALLSGDFIMIGSTVYGYQGSPELMKLPSDADRIAPGAFSDRPDLKNAVVPDNVREIGKDAFAGCDNLLTLTAPGFSPDSFDGEKLRFAAVMGFLCHDGEYPPDTAAFYRREVVSCLKKAAETSVGLSLEAPIQYMMETSMFDEALYGALLEEAQTKQRMGIVAMLLNYKKKALAESDPLASLRLD